MKIIERVLRALGRPDLAAPDYHAESGLVAVFWQGGTGAAHKMWPNWPSADPRAEWVGVFDQTGSRCLVVAEYSTLDVDAGGYLRAAMAAAVEKLGYQVTSQMFFPPGPFGLVAYEVKATAAANLPADISKMAFRPAPITLPASV